MARFRIFISHKSHDKAEAEKLQSLLLRYASSAMEIFISEQITPGTPWLEWIQEKLVSSNMLLLLFTDPSLEWDWCLYEAGLFTDLRGKGRQTVVCIHDPDKEPPPPLKHLQSLPAREKDVRSFLEKLYTKTDFTGLEEPLAPYLAEQRDEFTRFVEEVTQLLNRAPVAVRPYGKQLQIEIANPGRITEGGIPQDAWVTGDRDALSLFDKDQGNWKWQEIEAQARLSHDQKWLAELSRAIYRAANRATVRPIQESYSPPGSHISYRPCLYQMEQTHAGSMRFSLLFSENPSWNEDEVTTPVASFSDLIPAVVDLIDSTPNPGRVRMLTFTPALGFLARTEDEWKRLEKCIRKSRHKISMTCLTSRDLADWHNLFENRITDRGVVTRELIQAATAVAEDLLGQVGMITRRDWEQMPDYYVFDNERRAIVVTPFYLPRLDKTLTLDERSAWPNLEMFGMATNRPSVVQQLARVQTFYARPQGKGAIVAKA